MMVQHGEYYKMAIENINTNLDTETNIDWIDNGEQASAVVLNRPLQQVSTIINNNFQFLDENSLTAGSFGIGAETAPTLSNLDASQGTQFGFAVTGTTTGTFPGTQNAGLVMHINRGTDSQFSQLFFADQNQDSQSDKIYFRNRDASDLTGGWYEILHTGNFNPSQFTRNGSIISLSGDVSGSATVAVDGSITISNTVVANDSHAHSNYVVKNSNATLNTLNVPGGVTSSSFTADRFYLEAGKHSINNNDGSGNFNIKVATRDNANSECTDDGFGSHWVFDQNSGLWQFKTSATSKLVGEIYSWNIPLSFGPNTKVWTSDNDGPGSGLDADLLDGLQESTFMRRSSNSVLDMNNNDIIGVDQIVHEGDSDTFIQFHAADQFRVVTGGVERLEVNNTVTTISNVLHTNQINTSNGTELVLNAGESFGKFSGQTGESVYINGEEGLVVTTPNRAHPNFEAGYTADITQIRGDAMFISGNVVWHGGNDGPGSGLNADLLDGLNSSSFLRSDANDTFSRNSGVMVFQNNNNTMNSATGSLGPLEVNQPTSGKDAFMSFHVSGDYATYFGLDGSRNRLSTGGWSAGATKKEISTKGFVYLSSLTSTYTATFANLGSDGKIQVWSPQANSRISIDSSTFLVGDTITIQINNINSTLNIRNVDGLILLPDGSSQAANTDATVSQPCTIILQRYSSNNDLMLAIH